MKHTTLRESINKNERHIAELAVMLGKFNDRLLETERKLETLKTEVKK